MMKTTMPAMKMPMLAITIPKITATSHSRNGSRIRISIAPSPRTAKTAAAVLETLRSVSHRCSPAVILPRWAATGFLPIGIDETVGLQAPHQRINCAFPHIDPLREPAGDVVGVAIAPREQRQNAEFQHAFLQLNLDGFRHGQLQ